MKKIGDTFDKFIQERVAEILHENKFPDYDNVFTDTFSELIDKLIIVHIRYWYLEDAMANAKTDEDLVKYRKKSEILFKEKRPMLVEAIDKLFFKMMKGELNYSTTNLKKYDQWGDEK
jgi:hypothetical protein